MTPLAVFVRTLMKTSAVFLGATWIVLHPSLDWSSRSAAVTAELAPREAALAGLRFALSDRDPAVRRQAAEALAKIPSARPAYGDPARQTRTVTELVTDLTDGDAKDENARVREQAAWALGAIGNARATDALLSLLKDPDVGVRRQAAWAIGAIGR